MHRGRRQGDPRARTVVVFEALPDLGKGAVTRLGSTKFRVQRKVSRTKNIWRAEALTKDSVSMEKRKNRALFLNRRRSMPARLPQSFPVALPTIANPASTPIE